MWIKGGALGEPGSRSSNLALWTTVGLGITIGLCWIEYLNRKLLAREENGNGIERFPDDILGDIVSRLEFIEARRTSILSKRWRKIWTMKDSFMFYCHGTSDPDYRYSYVDRLRFLKIVNQSLDLYSGRKLKRFHVYCCFLNKHTCLVERWMQTLRSFDVEGIYLGHCCSTCNGEPLEKAFTFSFKLIHGLNKLKFLELTSCYLETTFVGQCNSLVKLLLRRVRLLSHELADILMLCPNLTRLNLERCELPLNLRISGPNLKLEDFRLDACCHVQKLEITDINIVDILIHIHSEVEISLSALPKLSCLDLRTPRMNYSFKDNAARDDLPLLNYLLIQTTYQILRLPSKFEVFGKVRVLCLLTKGFHYGETCKEVDLWNFAPVLAAAPLLEDFCLTVGGPACKRLRQEKEWPVLQHKCLKHVELTGFSNTQNELEFAKFIVRSTPVLRTLCLQIRFRTFEGDAFYLECRTCLPQKYTEEAVSAYLKGHFLSSNAVLKLL